MEGKMDGQTYATQYQDHGSHADELLYSSWRY